MPDVTISFGGAKVIGFHFVGPNAGEITQGFGLAVRLGAKKSDFDKLVSAFISLDAMSLCPHCVSLLPPLSYMPFFLSWTSLCSGFMVFRVGL